ncbi:hypothetical protein GGU10DRAFT_171770 [Lentinula aff. detonsa]|uniref:Uncharacterized protein n=1 Tax=Lentinula aff. detonsa TaxID=2804958 RepID=A0AA38L507_9AGAR|nr:hypothetical protein GGU10DRAFT_171770 [Lentinula aff. detonsa]
MKWLNIHFIEPSSEEGDQLSSLDRPWKDENFWPYLTRSTRGLSKASFFSDSLLHHPSSGDLQDLIKDAHTCGRISSTAVHDRRGLSKIEGQSQGLACGDGSNSGGIAA